MVFGRLINSQFITSRFNTVGSSWKRFIIDRFNTGQFTPNFVYISNKSSMHRSLKYMTHTTAIKKCLK